jgi:N-terminal domain of galactosyltransferase
MIGGHKVSVVTGCRNRTSFLLQSIVTWLSEPIVDEVVVVDWSSEPPLTKELSRFLNDPHTQPGWDDPSLVVARALKQDTWHLTKCYNLGLQVATGDLILKLDVDVKLKHLFFDRHPIARGQFYAGDLLGMRAPLWGDFLAFREDLLKVGGWNERLIGYGWDDEDLYNRLSQLGLHRMPMHYPDLFHIDHGNDLRQGEGKESLSDSTARNIRSSAESPWTEKDQMTKWAKTREGNIILCEPQ